MHFYRPETNRNRKRKTSAKITFKNDTPSNEVKQMYENLTGRGEKRKFYPGIFKKTRTNGRICHIRGVKCFMCKHGNSSRIDVEYRFHATPTKHSWGGFFFWLEFDPKMCLKARRVKRHRDVHENGHTASACPARGCHTCHLP